MTKVDECERLKNELGDVLRRAFAQKALLRRDDLVDLAVGDIKEKNLIADRLVGKEWTEVVDYMFLGCGDLAALTAEGFVCYFPACLNAALDIQQGDMAAHHVVYWASPPDELAKNWKKERYQSLIQLPHAQRQAVRDVLKFIDKYRHGEFPRNDARKALDAYWTSV